MAWRWDPALGTPTSERHSHPTDADAAYCTSITEDALGRVLMAGEQISRFDGTTWERLPDSGGYSAISTDAQGVVWAVGGGKISRWEIDSLGQEFRVDISTPPGVDLGHAYGMYPAVGGLYIVTFRDVVYVAGDDTVQHWGFGDGAKRLLPFWADGGLRIYNRGEGLHALRDGNWELILPESEATASGISSMLPLPGGDWLLSTITDGFLRWGVDGSLEPIFEHLGDLTDSTCAGLMVHDGLYSYGTLTGAYMIDSDGRVILDQDCGMVLNMMSARNGDLWVATHKGAFRFPRAGLSSYPEYNGLWVIDVNWSDGPAPNVFAGGNIYNSAKEGRERRAEPWLPSGRKIIWGGLRVGDFTVISADGATELISPDRVVVDTAPGSPNLMSLWPSTQANRFFRNSVGEVICYDVVDGALVEYARIALDQNIATLYQTNSRECLACTTSGAVFRLPAPDRWRSGERAEVVTFRGVDAGTPSWTQFATLDGRSVVAINAIGVYRYLPHARAFELAHKFEGERTFSPRESAVTECVDGSVLALQRINSLNGSKRTALTSIRLGASGALDCRPIYLPSIDTLLGTSVMLRDQVSAEGRRYLWVGTSVGLWRYDLSGNVTPQPPTAQILHLISNGHREPIDCASIKYSKKGVHLRFAAPGAESKITDFQTRVDGLDTNWVATRTGERELLNLGAGSYTARVRAIDEFGRAGPEATHSFTVLPPIWQTWGAYLIYACGGALGIWLITRLQLRIDRRRRACIEQELRAQLSNEERHLLQTRERLQQQDAELETIKAAGRHMIASQQGGRSGEYHQALAEFLPLLEWDRVPDMAPVERTLNVHLANTSIEDMMRAIEFAEMSDEQRRSLRMHVKALERSQQEILRRLSEGEG